MNTHNELALFEYLLKDEAFQRYRQKLEDIEQQLLQEAAFCKSPARRDDWFKNCKRLKNSDRFCAQNYRQD